MSLVGKTGNSLVLDSEINAINILIKTVSEKHNISFRELISMLDDGREKTVKFPCCILREGLGVLEAVVKYMKEEKDMTYHNIAVLLNRDERAIWVSHSKAVKKKKEVFEIKEPNLWIDVSIFTDRNLGPLEAVTKYLKENANLSFNEIAKLTGRDNRTIWTSYNRKKQKK